jgi:hypothetical protein
MLAFYIGLVVAYHCGVAYIKVTILRREMEAQKTIENLLSGKPDRMDN